jgi:PAS domain S-box-containing protein
MQTDRPLILVVDDDPTNLNILVEKLSRRYRLGVAKSGAGALQYLQKRTPDLILLDVMMPDMDGYQVCSRIKADPELRDIPVVFISFVNDPVQKTHGFEVGGVDYITKPFHEAEVLARVRTHISNNRMRRELERHNRQMGQELTDHRRQLALLLNKLPGLAYRERIENGAPHPDRPLVLASEGVLELTGYGPEAFLGEKGLGLMDITHEEDRPLVRKKIREGLAARTPWEQIYRIVTADGPERWVWEQSSGVFDESGTLLSVEGLLNDVTEKQQRELVIQKENKELREQLQAKSFKNIVGRSAPMQEVFTLLARAGATNDCVIIYGESGTGKELAARAVHECSARCNKPFIPVNCGAITESLFESEFFGHRKGAFTGALGDKKGCLDLADGGTLFLDELGELSLSSQTKLLRAIEGHGFTPVGGTALHTPSFRIIAATNRDLAERVRQGKMREDFYYRIHVIPIHLPPLRERREDIPLLIEHFLGAYPSDNDLPAITPGVLQQFMHHDWPGNIRELHNALYRYLTLGRLPGKGPARPVSPRPTPSEHHLEQESLATALEEFEKEFLRETLDRNDWKRNETAAALGINRRTLFRKMKQFHLDDGK